MKEIKFAVVPLDFETGFLLKDIIWKGYSYRKKRDNELCYRGYVNGMRVVSIYYRLVDTSQGMRYRNAVLNEVKIFQPINSSLFTKKGFYHIVSDLSSFDRYYYNKIETYYDNINDAIIDASNLYYSFINSCHQVSNIVEEKIAEVKREKVVKKKSAKKQIKKQTKKRSKKG